MMDVPIPRFIKGSAGMHDPERPPIPAPAAKPTEEGTTMPRGVYERKKNGEASPPPVAGKKKRKYARRAKAAEADLKALANQALIEAGAHLAASVRESVEDIDEAPALAAALRGYELAQKIAQAAGD